MGTTAASAATVAPLPEGTDGMFCNRSAAPLKLFRRGDFHFCADGPLLPAKIEAAVLGEPPAPLLAAIGRFGATLHKAAGVEVSQGKHPGVIFVVGAQPFTPSSRRPPLFADRIAGTGIVLAPEVLERIGNKGDVGGLKSTMSMTAEGKTEVTLQTIFSAEDDKDLADDVKRAFVAFLRIKVPMTRPEEVEKTDAGSLLHRDYDVKPWLEAH